jgi:predicted DNA-binding transcriptional regulator YafY
MGKILQSLPSGLRGVCTHMAEGVEVRWPAMADTTAIRQTYQRLQDAAASNHKVRLTYDSYYEKREIVIILHPYVQALLNRAWYVVGHCEAHNQVRMFNLDRIIQAEVLEATFARPEGFSLDGHLGKAWALICEGKEHAVRLRFTPKVAGNVEEIIWHSTQRTQRLADGSLILEVDVDGLTEISWWIMGYGDQVTVEEPPELRARVLKMAKNIVRSYKG